MSDCEISHAGVRTADASLREVCVATATESSQTRGVDVLTDVSASTRAVQRNPRPCRHNISHRPTDKRASNSNPGRACVSGGPRNIVWLWVYTTEGWLGSRVVSVLDSGAESPGSNRSRDAVG